MSAAEISYFALQHKDVNMLKTKDQPSYRRIPLLLERPRQLQSVIFIAKIFSHVCVALIINLLVGYAVSFTALPVWANLLIISISALTYIILFLEILPRLWAANHKIFLASKSSFLLEILGTVLFNYAKGLNATDQLLEKKMNVKGTTQQDDAELDNAIDLLPDSEATQAEKQILKGIRKFGNTTVRQIMRPRMDVSGIEQNTDFEQLVKLITDLHYSRLPVYNNNLDEPIGILHTKDVVPFLHEGKEYNWLALVRQPLFVHEQKYIEDLMQDFLQKRIHFAIVVDEFGGTSGIVTLEDVMEEIIGDIKDDFDDEENQNKKLDEHNYIFEGKMVIEDALGAMKLPADTFDEIRGESNSLGGLILEIAGDFPVENQKFIYSNFELIPLSISKNRIEQVQIRITENPNPVV